VEPDRSGLALRRPDGTRAIVPLYAGAMHYWRHPPDEWGAGLDAIKALGLGLVDTYVPWAVHELGPGSFDFGEKNPRLDVARFVRMAEERGLFVVLRPGPHINAELTSFGIPERVIWTRECQARTPRDNPVMLPIVPLAFPVPSYASEVFHEETARWFDAVGKALAPLVYPSGPIVLVQVDNEGALYFRDGPFDQDYHPDSIALFRAFLRAKYKTPKALRDAWRDPEVVFATAVAPTRFEATTLDDLVRPMDWMEFHEHLLGWSMMRMKKALDAAGLQGVPSMHNFPMGEGATPLNAARMSTSIDFVGLDYYQRAHPIDHLIVMRRTTELAVRCEGQGTPPYGAEVGAGFPPFFAPLDEADSLYTLMAAMAYGLRGFNLYMAVERDRWVGAPVDPHGKLRPFAHAFQALVAALETTEFHTLRRRAPVRLVIPRSLRRLARATHAFGSATPALFNVLGVSLRESCFEEGYCEGEAPPIAAERYLRAFERALAARGVPFAYVGGETLEDSVHGAAWIVCPTVGGLKRELVASLRAAAKGGARVTVGPTFSDRDGNLRPMSAPHDARGLELEPLDDLARADALVARRIDELGLPTYPVDPDDVFVTIHEDASQRPRVAFVMNPSASSLTVRVALSGATELTDLLDDRRPPIQKTSGGFEIEAPARTVRMLSIG
jgi:beta-galactosidase